MKILSRGVKNAAYFLLRYKAETSMRGLFSGVPPAELAARGPL